MTEVPDIGTTFRYRDAAYVVTGWLKPTPDASALQQHVGPDRVAVQFCPRSEAIYVCGSGVAGCIARIADVEVTGTAQWSAEQVERERNSANLLGGNKEKVW